MCGFNFVKEDLLTKRLTLRGLLCKDAQFIFEMRNDNVNNRFLNRKKAVELTKSISFIDKILKGEQTKEWVYWLIESNNEKASVGTICLWNFSDDRSNAEIGFELHPKYKNKGYVIESARSVVEFAFNKMHFNKILAYTHNDNERSLNVLSKLGFKPARYNTVSAYKNSSSFLLTKDDFKSINV